MVQTRSRRTMLPIAGVMGVGAALLTGQALHAERSVERLAQRDLVDRHLNAGGAPQGQHSDDHYRITPKRRALLNTIRYAEGTWKDGTDLGYQTLYGGGQFADLSRHPDRVVVRRYASAAAGAYQFLPSTWRQVAHELNLSSFEPRQQDQAALRLVERRGALTEVDRNGLTRLAMHKLSPEWASFPTYRGFSAYGQPAKRPADLAAFYSENLRQIRRDTSTRSQPDA
ncbi:MAG: endolysin [Synechococcus sp.]